MFELRDSDLSDPLFAFAIASYLLFIAWAEIRKKDNFLVSLMRTAGEQDRSLFLKNRQLRLLMLGAITLILCFRMAPEFYQHFVPVLAFDPYFNLLGVITTFCALTWTSVIQLEFDTQLFRCKAVHQQMLTADVVQYARKIQLGYLLIICSIAITLASMVSLVLVLATFALYYGNRR